MITILGEIYAIVKFLSALWPLVAGAWASFQEHRTEVASAEAAARLKIAGQTARATGDTSGLEKFFNPGRTYVPTPAQNPPPPATPTA